MIGVDVWGVANILSNVKILFILFIDLKINITSNFIIMITLTIYCILLLSMVYSDAQTNLVAVIFTMELISVQPMHNNDK